MESRRARLPRDILNSWRIGVCLAVIKVEARRLNGSEKISNLSHGPCGDCLHLDVVIPAPSALMLTCIGNFASRVTTFLTKTSYPLIVRP